MTGRPQIHGSTLWRCPIDLAKLRKEKRSTGSVVWSNFLGPYGTVFWSLGEHELQVTCHYGDQWIEETIALVQTDTAFGGHRQWLRCPECRGRCRRVYAGSRGYRCRRCYGLMYPSQREDPTWRNASRSQVIRMWLGGTANLMMPFPARPKGMHWRTYDRLRQREKRFMERYFSAMASKLRIPQL